MSDIKESAPYDRVILHPLVLLSATDHFNRIGNVSRNARVVGALLGSVKIVNKKKILDISNSFAIPFDEDSKDAQVWYIDHDYLDTMFKMYRKVNAKERIVGWYHTGPELRANDTEINEIFKKYTKNSILSIIETTTNDWSLPTKSYYCVEEVHDDGTPSTKTFNHLPCEIGAEEAEEVGVEHLLRDVHSNTQGTLSQRISNQIKGLKGFGRKLNQISQYLKDVAEGKLPMNYNIIYGLQDVFNLLPDVQSGKFNNALQQITNDQMLIVYLASMIKSVIALHNLIDNKLDMNEKERQEQENEVEEQRKKIEEKEKLEKEKAEKAKMAGDAKSDGKGESEKSSDNNTKSANKKASNMEEHIETFEDLNSTKTKRQLLNDQFEMQSCKLQQQLLSLAEKLSLDRNAGFC